MRPTEVLFRRLRRLALTTKQANKGFYKGTGTGSTGRHTKHGGYVIEWAKVRTYVAPPNLKTFTVSTTTEDDTLPYNHKLGWLLTL
jgi:large subunit ribosomal protein L41